MANFKRGRSVITLVIGSGIKVASGPRKVQSVSKDGVVIVEGSRLKFNADTGLEIEPANPSLHSEIVDYEG